MASDSWWRFYNTAPDHPKVLLLTDAQFRAWVTLNSLASKLGGTIPPDMALIAMTIRKTTGKASEIVQVLLSAKLLDPVDGGFQPHNWNEKQFKSDVSTERVKRFRNSHRNVSETPHRQSTEAETEKKSSLRSDIAPKAVIQIPEWIPQENWRSFLEMRLQKKAKNTDRAILLLIAELKKLRSTNDIAAVLDQSTMNSWKGVFPVKHDAMTNGQRTKPANSYDRFNAGAALAIASFGGNAVGSGEAELGGDADRPQLPLLAS